MATIFSPNDSGANIPVLTRKSKATRPIYSCVLFLGGFLVCAHFCLHAQTSPGPSPANSTATLSQDEVVRGIDSAVDHRSKIVSGYTVQELYTIFRNNDSNPAVQVTVKTVYNRSTGKDYTTVATTGSSLLRSAVVDKVIANEKEMAKASNRESVALTSANYEMTLLPGVVPQNGHQCLQVQLKARRKVPFLFNGKAWFDASDFTLVHIEGSPAASPSFFAGATSGARDYSKVDGFSMAQHAEIHSHSFLFGDTLMKIDYSDYQIQTDSAAASIVTQQKPTR